MSAHDKRRYDSPQVTTYGSVEDVTQLHDNPNKGGQGTDADDSRISHSGTLG